MDTNKQISDLGHKIEDLHPDLLDYLDLTSGSFPMLRHPLVYLVPYSTGMNAFLNKQYEQKKNAIQNCLNQKDYHGYVFMHERPYRINAFLEVADKIVAYMYWEILGDIWIDSENIFRSKKLWRKALNSKKPHRKYFMSDEDRITFYQMPNEITVYRGYTIGLNKQGFSYSLSEEKARWFAERFNREKACVSMRKVKKEDIFAYTSARNEDEIIILK